LFWGGLEKVALLACHWFVLLVIAVGQYLPPLFTLGHPSLPSLAGGPGWIHWCLFMGLAGWDASHRRVWQTVVRINPWSGGGGCDRVLVVLLGENERA